jgi:hypothetical protein
MKHRIRAVASIVILAVIVLLVVYAYSTLRLTTQPSSTSTTALASSIPVVKNFSFQSTSAYYPHYLAFGARAQSTYLYSNSLRNYSLLIRSIAYANSSIMLHQYATITAYGSANSTMSYLQGLPANSSGVQITNPAQHSLYSMTNHAGLDVITITLTYEGNALSESAGVGILLSALNATYAALASGQ